MAEAAAPANVLRLVVVAYAVGALAVGPSLFVLFRVFKTQTKADVP